MRRAVAVALIRCEDCGHKVSTLALACPQCARPVARLIESVAVGEGGTGGARLSVVRTSATPKEPASAARFDAPLTRATLEWREKLRKARTSPDSKKKYLHYKKNITLNTFRTKS